MDDDKFKKEILLRLDKIMALLTVSCRLSDGALDKAQAETLIRQIVGTRQAVEQTESTPYQIRDEMQDDYLQAVQKWKAERSQ